MCFTRVELRCFQVCETDFVIAILANRLIRCEYLTRVLELIARDGRRALCRFGGARRAVASAGTLNRREPPAAI